MTEHKKNMYENEENDREDEIYKHEDLLIKKLASDYGQEFLDYLDALYHENHKDPLELPSKKIKSKSATEIVTPDLKNLYMDFAYDMDNGSILHYEHYSGVLTEENLVHTGCYVFEKRRETKKDIVTIIVSTGDPKKSARIVWLNERTNFLPFRTVFLKEYDGAEKLKKIKNKVKNRKKLTFDKIIEMVLMALFDNSRPPEEVVEEVCYLTTKLVDATPEERNLLRWGLILVSNKFVKDRKKLRKLRRVITMNNESIYGDLHSYFQSEREEYGAEQRLEGKQERDIEIAGTMLSRGYSLEEIVEITHLDIASIKALRPSK